MLYQYFLRENNLDVEESLSVVPYASNVDIMRKSFFNTCISLELKKQDVTSIQNLYIAKYFKSFQVEFQFQFLKKERRSENGNNSCFQVKLKEEKMDRKSPQSVVKEKYIFRVVCILQLKA